MPNNPPRDDLLIDHGSASAYGSSPAFSRAARTLSDRRNNVVVCAGISFAEPSSTRRTAIFRLEGCRTRSRSRRDRSFPSFPPLIASLRAAEHRRWASPFAHEQDPQRCGWRQSHEHITATAEVGAAVPLDRARTQNAVPSRTGQKLRVRVQAPCRQ